VILSPRADIGAHVHDTTPTVIPTPRNQPEADVIYPGKYLLELVNIRPVAGCFRQSFRDAIAIQEASAVYCP
jgi:hypothetical protein